MQRRSAPRQRLGRGDSASSPPAAPRCSASSPTCRGARRLACDGRAAGRLRGAGARARAGARLRARRPRRPAAVRRPRAARLARSGRGRRLPAPRLGRGRAAASRSPRSTSSSPGAPTLAARLPRPARRRGEASGEELLRGAARAAGRTRAAPRPRRAASGCSPSSAWCRETPDRGRGDGRGRILRGDRSGALGGVRAYSARYQEARRFLEGRRQP